MNRNWKISQYCENPPRYNLCRFEDACSSYTEGDVCAMALCDGSETAVLSHIGASSVSEFTAKYFAEHFDSIYEAQFNTACEELIKYHQAMISRLAEDALAKKGVQILVDRTIQMRELNKFASSVQVLAVKGDKAIYFKVGNGGAVIASNGAAFTLSDSVLRDPAIYVTTPNPVNLLISCDFKAFTLSPSCYAIALTTDGAEFETGLFYNQAATPFYEKVLEDLADCSEDADMELQTLASALISDNMNCMKDNIGISVMYRERLVEEPVPVTPVEEPIEETAEEVIDVEIAEDVIEEELVTKIAEVETVEEVTEEETAVEIAEEATEEETAVEIAEEATEEETAVEIVEEATEEEIEVEIAEEATEEETAVEIAEEATEEEIEVEIVEEPAEEEIEIEIAEESVEEEIEVEISEEATEEEIEVEIVEEATEEEIGVEIVEEATEEEIGVEIVEEPAEEETEVEIVEEPAEEEIEVEIVEEAEEEIEAEIVEEAEEEIEVEIVEEAEEETEAEIVEEATEEEIKVEIVEDDAEEAEVAIVEDSNGEEVEIEIVDDPEDEPADPVEEKKVSKTFFKFFNVSIKKK